MLGYGEFYTSCFSFVEPWVQKTGQWLRPAMQMPRNNKEWLAHVIHNPIDDTPSFKIRNNL